MALAIYAFTHILECQDERAKGPNVAEVGVEIVEVIETPGDRTLETVLTLKRTVAVAGQGPSISFPDVVMNQR